MNEDLFFMCLYVCVFVNNPETDKLLITILSL